MPITHTRLLIVLSCTLLLGVFPGCHTANVTESLTDQYAGNDLDAQMEFWHSLAKKKRVSNDEAFHALILLYCQEDHADNYDQRVARLAQSDFLPASFNEPKNQAVQRGTVAYVLAKMLNIRGGVMMRLLGPQPRYVVKEMIYLNLFPDSSPHQIFSGPQFIEIIGRAEDKMTHVNRKASAAVLNNVSDSQTTPIPDAQNNPPTPQTQPKH